MDIDGSRNRVAGNNIIELHFHAGVDEPAMRCLVSSVFGSGQPVVLTESKKGPPSAKNANPWLQQPVRTGEYGRIFEVV